MKFVKDDRPQRPPIVCAGCQSTSGSKWFHYGNWFCINCVKTPMPLPQCRKCGEMTVRYGIEQFAIGSMGSDAYAFEQGLGAVCPNRHVTIVAQQWGPGAKNAGESIR